MTNVWVIRSHYGKYAGHFVDGCYVGAGWLLGYDLSKVETKDELTAIYRQAHPDPVTTGSRLDCRSTPAIS